MREVFFSALLVFGQILSAGNTITAFSLLLYALTFNLRERVARTFALVLACLTLVACCDGSATELIRSPPEPHPASSQAARFSPHTNHSHRRQTIQSGSIAELSECVLPPALQISALEQGAGMEGAS